MIGNLTEVERLDKVRNYYAKKHVKTGIKKFSYKCRRQVADKRLRIKGRFVTKEQAFEILGLTQNELLDNAMIQNLLTSYESDPIQMNSMIESQKNGGQLIKVRNFQALIDKNYSHSNTAPAEEKDEEAVETSSDLKTPEMLKQMIQLNMRITNKTSQLPSGYFGLNKPNDSQFGAFPQTLAG